MKRITGKLIQRTPGGKWYVRYTVNGKTTNVSTGKTNKQEAEVERKRIIAPFHLQSQGERLEANIAKLSDTKTQLAAIEEKKNPPLLIRDAWRTFEDSAKRPDSGPATLANYANQWKQFNDWLTDKYPKVTFVKEVNPKIAGAYAAHLLRVKKVTPNTFNKHIRLLDLVFRVVQDSARWTVNPWTKDQITRKTQVAHSRRELTVEELWKVCTDAPGELQLLLAIGIYTGLRRGDCATLRWGEVDLIRGRIVRIPAKTGRRHPEPVIISLHPTLAAMLAAIPADKRTGEYVLPETAEKYRTNERELTRDIQDHFVNCGVQIHKPGTGMKRVQKTIKGKTKYESVGDRAVVEVGFHSLRHTFVSLCREGNVPLAVVEKLVGHSNPAMTRHYTHVSEQAQHEAMLCLPDVLKDHDEPSPTQPASDDLGTFKARVAEIAKAMGAKTWEAAQAELLELAESV